MYTGACQARLLSRTPHSALHVACWLCCRSWGAASAVAALVNHHFAALGSVVFAHQNGASDGPASAAVSSGLAQRLGMLHIVRAC